MVLMVTKRFLTDLTNLRNEKEGDGGMKREKEQ